MTKRLGELSALLGVTLALTVGTTARGPVSLGTGATVDAHGATIVVGGDAVRIGLARIGRDGAMTEVERRAPEPAADVVRLARLPGVVEWWRRVEAGLEQGVTIDAAPPGAGPLVLEMATGPGTHAVAEAGAITIAGDDDRRLARYGELAVVDAAGARVPATLLADAGRLVLRVEDAGALYPLVVDPLVVAEEATLSAPLPDIDDGFGSAVAMSADGTRILVGAYYASPGGVVEAGSAFVFRRTGTTWTLEANLVASDRAPQDYFGTSVALTPDADRAVIGAVSDDLAAQNDVGSARVFVRSGTVWTEEATLEPSTPRYDAWFGRAVSIDGTGTRIAVGSALDDTPGGSASGSVRIFRRSGATWTEEVTFNGPHADALLGYSVAIDDAGDVVAAGAREANVGAARAGAVRAYRRTGTVWVDEGVLPTAMPHVDRYLGFSVAISPDGTRIAGGAPFENVMWFEQGAVHVWQRAGTAWGELPVATNPAGQFSDRFGTAVAFAADGRRMLVGADFTLVGSSDSGAAYLARETPSGWAIDAMLAPVALGDGDAYGAVAAIARDGSVGVVGAELHDTGGLSDSGAAFVFRATGPGTVCATGADCGSGACTDGVCCDRPCGDGAADCQSCLAAVTGGTNGRCAPTTAGTECRAVATLCDAAEACDGVRSACPENAPAASGTLCRVSAGACDPEEVCDGASYACPGNTMLLPGSVCRASAGDCDLAESCTGTATCPPDGFAVPTTTCRMIAGACDVAENCTGTTALCPADVFMAMGTVCDATLGGDCDAPDVCSGSSAVCTPTFLVGVECRSSAGECDAPESCTGATAACPTDTLLPAGVVCRASTAACDPAEACDAIDPACPTDLTTCEADAGPIDAGVPDAGVPPTDGGPADASTDGGDAGPAGPAPAGCHCRVTPRPTPPLGLVALLGLALLRRRGAAPTS